MFFFVLIKITYCRDGQLRWLEGHFERPRSAEDKHIILPYWVHCARFTLQNNKRRGPENTEVSRHVPRL